MRDAVLCKRKGVMVHTIRLYGTASDSIVDGPGLRYAVFVQGCTHGCPGCHNSDSQPARGGVLASIDDIVASIAENGLVQGVTISGGEPFEQAEACAELACRVRELGLGVWTYSGYRYEDLVALIESAGTGATVAGEEGTPHIPESPGFSVVDPAGARRLLQATDVLVDGPFVQALHSYDLAWRGSSNQRLIDVPATRACHHIVVWETGDTFPQKPSSW